METCEGSLRDRKSRSEIGTEEDPDRNLLAETHKDPRSEGDMEPPQIPKLTLEVKSPKIETAKCEKTPPKVPKRNLPAASAKPIHEDIVVDDVKEEHNIVGTQEKVIVESASISLQTPTESEAQQNLFAGVEAQGGLTSTGGIKDVVHTEEEIKEEQQENKESLLGSKELPLRDKKFSPEVKKSIDGTEPVPTVSLGVDKSDRELKDAVLEKPVDKKHTGRSGRSKLSGEFRTGWI